MKTITRDKNEKKEKSQLPTTILPRLAIIRPHPPLIPLNLLHPLPPRNTPIRLPILKFRLLTLINFNRPIFFSGLILALVSPSRHPFSALFVVDELLLPLGIHASIDAGSELADALLTRKQFPFCGCFGLREGFLAWEGIACCALGREAEKDAGWGAGDWTGCEELVEEDLSAVAG